MAPLFQELEINFIWLNRKPVSPAVKRIAKRQPTSTWKPARASAHVAASRIRIQDAAECCAVIVCFLGSAITEYQEVLESIFDTRTGAALPIVRAAKRSQVT